MPAIVRRIRQTGAPVRAVRDAGGSRRRCCLPVLAALELDQRNIHRGRRLLEPGFLAGVTAYVVSRFSRTPVV